jgi:hypothetical protein
LEGGCTEKAHINRYGTSPCSPPYWSWRLVGVGVPSLMGLLGAVLVAASPQRPGTAVHLVAAGLGDGGPAELS